jgi:hypothetical protein
MAINFDAVIQIRGINPFVEVSSSVASALKPGWRKALPVLIRINGKPTDLWRVNMMPMGNGNFYLYLHDTVRKASRTTVGDCVRVEVQFDVNYRNGPQQRMPTWFKQALDSNAQAKKNWNALIPSRKKEVIRYLSQLVTADAQTRNLAKALRVLSGEEGRFMARDWKSGS